MPPQIFPFDHYWWFYLAFSFGVLLIVALDMGVLHKSPRQVSYREACLWVGLWFSLAMVFNYALYQYTFWKASGGLVGAAPEAAALAKRVALEFFTGYVIEQSLSVDNIFVFVIIFRHFAIPPQFQHRVLIYGILGALILRGMFIGIGSGLLRYHWMLWLFGGFLIFSGAKLLMPNSEEADPEDSPIVRYFQRVIPTTPELHGEAFWVRMGAKWVATPLMVTVVCLEVTDILFALDSVPAIFAITREPLIVYTSNMFAILGLRSLYFVLANSVDKFHLLHYGLAIVLIFVGLKMTVFPLLRPGGAPIALSLAFILTVIAASIVLSLVFPRAEEPEMETEGQA